MIKINEQVSKYINEGGLKTIPEGKEIKNKISNIALSADITVDEIDQQLSELETVLEDKSQEVLQKAEVDFLANPSNYSVQVEEQALSVEKNNLMIKIKNILNKIKNIFNRKEIKIQDNEANSAKESMKRIFMEGVKLALKIALDRTFKIGIIADIFEFGVKVKKELENIYENSNLLLRSQRRELIMEH